MSSTPFGYELTEARHELAADVAEAASERTRQAVREFVGSLSTVDANTRKNVIDLLTLSPAGLPSDHPLPEVFRNRLGALAGAAALLLDLG